MNRRTSRPGRGSAAGVCLAAAFALVSGGAALAAEAGERAETDLGAFRETVLGFSDLMGKIDAETLIYWSFPPITDVQSNLVITANRDWRFANIRGDFCGGSVSAEAEIDFHRRPKARREFRFESRTIGIDLEEMARQTDYAVPPGIVNTSVKIKVTSEGSAGLSGEAEVRLRNGNLGRFPLVLKALSVLGFPGIEKETIENGDASLILTPRAMVVQDLSFSTPTGGFRLEANRLGTIGYDGRLDLYFKPVLDLRLIKAVPVLGELASNIIDDVQQRGMRIKLTGTVAEPRFQWAPFR